MRMARKKKDPEHANHERWLVSYSDFITLLFAFFVVMFATSQTDKGKAQQVSECEEGAGGPKNERGFVGGARRHDFGQRSGQRHAAWPRGRAAWRCPDL